MGNLYQLSENQFKLLGGNIVQIDGPHDKYGRIVKYQKHNSTYLIRGTGNTRK